MDFYSELFDHQDKYKVIQKYEDFCVGDILTDDEIKKIPSKFYEKRHGFTIHSIQGETAENKLIIELCGIYDLKMIYTALSRSRFIDNVYLVQTKSKEFGPIISKKDSQISKKNMNKLIIKTQRNLHDQMNIQLLCSVDKILHYDEKEDKPFYESDAELLNFLVLGKKPTQKKLKIINKQFKNFDKDSKLTIGPNQEGLHIIHYK